MKYLISGIVAGFAAGIFFFQSASGMEIVPEFYSGLDTLDALEWADGKEGKDGFVVTMEGKTFVVNSRCQIVNRIDTADVLYEFSGNGAFYIKYDKVGSEIELLGLAGERYLKMKSMEKPFLSYSGELILLMNGDHTSIRIFDKNGNQTGAGRISGRLCTSVEFSNGSDYAACGFADGSFYFLDRKGNIMSSGMLRPGDVVKGIAVSPGGLYGLVHYGNTDSDRLRLVNIREGESEETDLPAPHYVKTAMCVSDSGEGAFLDHNAVLFTDNDCDIDYRLSIPAKRPGYSTLSYGSGVYSLCYTKSTGEPQLLFFSRESRNIIYAKEFAGLSFLGAEVRDRLIFARGSDSLFAYRIRP